MLKILYKQDGAIEAKEYADGAEFIANQQFEVPDLEESLEITSASLDDKELDFGDKTVSGLYHFLIK